MSFFFYRKNKLHCRMLVLRLTVALAIVSSWAIFWNFRWANGSRLSSLIRGVKRRQLPKTSENRPIEIQKINCNFWTRQQLVPTLWRLALDRLAQHLDGERAINYLFLCWNWNKMQFFGGTLHTICTQPENVNANKLPPFFFYALLWGAYLNNGILCPF